MKRSKCLLLLIICVFFNCNQTKKETLVKNENIPKIETEREYEIEQTVCLKKEDSLLIKKFNDKLKIGLKTNDRNLILNNIQIPFISEEEEYSEDEFLISFLDVLKEYYFKDFIDSEVGADLKREMYFSLKKETKDCYQYIISNDFPEQEFNVRFFLDKIDGKIKIVKILLIG